MGDETMNATPSPPSAGELDTTSTPRSAPLASVPKIGVWAWSFIGVVVATAIVVTALGAVSEIVLPLLFAAVLAVIFKPLVGTLKRHGLKPTLAAGLIVLGLLLLMTVVLIATVRGVIDQTDEIGASVDAAIESAGDLGIDQAALKDARAASEETAPAVAEGFLTKLVSGLSALVGVAGGLILGALIMYYLLKDGRRLRRVGRRADRPTGPRMRSTTSSVTRAGSSANTDEAAP